MAKLVSPVLGYEEKIVHLTKMFSVNLLAAVLDVLRYTSVNYAKAQDM